MSFWNNVKKALVGDAPAEEPAKAEPVVKKAEVQEPAAEAPKETSNGAYKRCKIVHGARGWGGPLEVLPTEEKNLIYSVTGGGIHPVAQKIADLTGGQTFDGFKSNADFSKIAVAVIDCGGTARVGVYPMKGVLTVDIHPTTPAGPLAKFINEQNFVSGVKETDISLVG